MLSKKKCLIATIVITLLILLSGLTYAELNDYYANMSEEEITKEEVAKEVNLVLGTLNDTETVSASNVNLKTYDDKFRGIEFYNIKTNKYILYINSSSNKISKIKNKTYDTKRTATATNDEAKSFILNIYDKLNLPSEYELMYLEPFSTKTLWEADFQKNYDGIYNKYEAVKVIFDPAAKEIIGLTVFNNRYDEELQVSTEFDNPDRMHENELFSTNLDDGENQGITFIKPSLLSENNLKTDTIMKAKVVKKTTGKRVTLNYFDYYTNIYLGGDLLL